jgi:hypothetical protein
VHHALRRTFTTAAVLAGLVAAPLAAPLGAPFATPAAALTSETLIHWYQGYANSPGPQLFDQATGATITVTPVSSTSPAVGVSGWSNYTQFSVDLVPPSGATFAAGHTYPVGTAGTQARLYCSNTYASSGTLRVDGIARSSTGAYTTLAVTYDAVCAGRPEYATIRYHSTVPWRGVQPAVPSDVWVKTGTPKDVDVTFTGIGSDPSHLGTATVESPSTVVADGCAGSTLDRGQTCTVRVGVLATTTGSYAPVLTVPADEHGPLTVPIRVGAADPPAAPSSVRAVAGDDGIALSWLPPPYSWQGPPIPTYRVYRDSGTTPIAEPAGPFVDPVAPGETHTYTVAAVGDPTGEGAPSDPVSATVPATAPDPGPVTGLAIDGPDGDSVAETVTAKPGSFGTVSLSGITIAPVSGSAWTAGTVRAAVTFDPPWCGTQTTDIAVTEARVHADGTPVVLAAALDITCPGNNGTRHVEVRYAAGTGLVAPDTTPDKLYAVETLPGHTAAPQTVTVANHGTEGLVLGTATVPVDWALGTDTCSGTTVAPGASCTVAVSFSPVTQGAKYDALEIPDNTATGHRLVPLYGSAGGLPSAVRDLVATPLVRRTYLTWTVPESSYPTPVTYRVYSSTSATEWGTPVEVTATSYASTVGRPGQRVYFRVVAVNPRGAGPAATTDAVMPGRELMYTADTGDGVYHLYAQPLPGAAPVRLFRTTLDEEDPAVSADGTRLAFTREFAPGRWDVYVSGIDGNGLQHVAGSTSTKTMTYRHPAWSPDGTALAADCRPVDQTWFDLCLYRADTGYFQRTAIIPGVLGPPSWLPNNHELAVVAATNPTTVQVVEKTGKYRYDVPGTTNARQVEVSPEGGRIAWTRYEGDDVEPGTGNTPRYSLRVSSLSGGTGRVLSDTGYTNDPAWSTDGETVCYTHGERQSSGTIASRDVFSVGAGGGTPVRLTDTPTVDEDNVTVVDAVTPHPVPFVPRALADFSGDGHPEIAVFRPGDGTWHIRGGATVVYGRAGDIPVAADYTGDRKAEIAVFRPATGTWLIRGLPAVQYGARGDVPVPADYNGDGRADIAVFRPATGTWYIRGVGVFKLGDRRMVPVPADYDGDHKADVAAYLSSTVAPCNGCSTTGLWYIRNHTTLRSNPGLAPAPGDYRGSGHAEPAGFDGKSWYVRTFYGAYATVTPTGNDLPVWGPFDSAPGVEIGLFSPTPGFWRVEGRSTVTFGTAGDIPV